MITKKGLSRRGFIAASAAAAALSFVPAPLAASSAPFASSAPLQVRDLFYVDLMAEMERVNKASLEASIAAVYGPQFGVFEQGCFYNGVKPYVS